MRVEELLERLKREFIKVNLIQAALDSLVFFLATNLVLFLFGLNLLSGFSNLQVLTSLTLIFFAGDLYYRAQNYSLEIYEEKNPELREILRTARDNLDSQNIASQALFDEVMDRARNVTSDSIVPSKTIIQKILAVGFLSFLTVLSGLADFQIQEEGGDLLPGGEKIKEIVDQSSQDKEGFELKNSSEVFGEEQEIDAADLNIEFNITGSGEKSKEKNFGSPGTAGELLLDASGESLSQDLELAKQYSLAVKNMDS